MDTHTSKATAASILTSLAMGSTTDAQVSSLKVELNGLVDKQQYSPDDIEKMKTILVTLGSMDVCDKVQKQTAITSTVKKVFENVHDLKDEASNLLKKWEGDTKETAKTPEDLKANEDSTKNAKAASLSLFYFLDDNGKTQGPHEAHMMIDWYDCGWFSEKTHVKEKVDEDWKTFGDYSSLMAQVTPKKDETRELKGKQAVDGDGKQAVDGD